MVRGCTCFEIVRAAASENTSVDMLLHPCDIRSPLTIATARAARQSSLAIGFDLNPVILLRGSRNQMAGVAPP